MAATSTKNLVTVFFVLIALLSLFFTIISDVLLQHDDTFMARFLVPWNSLWGMENAGADFNFLLNPVRASEGGSSSNFVRHYIFVIDKSLSVEDEDPPTWYADAIQDLNDYIRLPQHRFDPDPNPSAFDAALARLGLILLKLEDSDSEFSIWTVGDDAGIICPTSHKMKSRRVDNASLLRALQVLKQQQQLSRDDPESYFTMNTNFVDLFRRLRAEYNLRSQGTTPFMPHKFTLVILSDLEHSVADRIRKQLEGQGLRGNKLRDRIIRHCQLDRDKLIAEINEITKADMLANLIVVPKTEKAAGDSPCETDIWPELKRNLFPYRINRVDLRDQSDELLYSNTPAKESIRFYYTNPHDIDSTSFSVVVKNYGNYKIGLTSPDTTASQRLTIRYQVLGANGSNKRWNGVPMEGVLPFGSLHTVHNLDEGDRIKLTYSGRLPDSVPDLKLLRPDSNRNAYIVSMDFIKKLPRETAAMMLALQLASIVVACWIIVRLIARRGKRKHKGEELERRRLVEGIVDERFARIVESLKREFSSPAAEEAEQAEAADMEEPS